MIPTLAWRSLGAVALALVLAAPVSSSAWTGIETTPASLSTTRIAAERVLVLQDNGFPRLGNQFEILGPRSDRYNCIAWSLGRTDRWIWPGTSVHDFDHLYGQAGFRRLPRMTFKRMRGTELVVLYAKMRGGRLECTHAARQLPDGTWSSKLGKLPLIRHFSPGAVAGGSYGSPIAVYIRTR